MLDLKEIQYFVKCAETESFSRAAELLYTTQPSVSRVIKAMEEELGFTLFERYNKGITLTQNGKRIYRHACRVISNMEKISMPVKMETEEVFRIAANPSSWFADTFLKFYKQHEQEPFRYEIHSIKNRDVVEKIQSRADDIGFVFVMKNQLPAFEYFLRRCYLEFHLIAETEIMLYGSGNQSIKDGDINFKNLKLIQRFSDEYTPDNYWDIRDEYGNLASELNAVVTTDSDYIMQRMLRETDLVNISGKSFSREERDSHLSNTILNSESDGISFGYVKRIGEKLPARYEELIQFITMESQ